MAKILLAEDDPSISESVIAMLKLEGHLLDHAKNGEVALDYLSVSNYDLMILDWQMPRLSGMDVCVRHRQSGGTTPILMLTAKEHIDDKELGFASGADDYLTKPFSPRELRARVAALIRRADMHKNELLQLGQLRIDLKNKKVWQDDLEIELRPVEFSILEYFLKHPDAVLSPEALMQGIWSAETESSVDTVYTSINRLRKRLSPEDRNAVIKTVHGFGYRLAQKPL